MPSSPEPMVTPMVLDELAPRRAVRRTEVRPHLFEVGSQRAMPAENPDFAAAQAAGYAAGWANGMRAAANATRTEAEQARVQAELATRQRQTRVDAAFAALDAAAARLERAAAVQSDALTDSILDAAYAIAEALVGHDLRSNPDRAPRALAHALSLVPHNEDVIVRLHPDDHAVLTEADLPVADRAVRLVADASLQPGDAVAVSGATHVDARITAGLARVRATLGVQGGAA